MKRAEVFTPNTLPSVTFVDDHLADKKKLLLQALEQGGAVVAISGPSKSGKTVFVETTLGFDNLIPVSGSNISSADELWHRVFTVIGTPIPTSSSTAKGGEVLVGGKVEGGVPLFAKAEGKLEGKASYTSTQTSDVRPDYLTLLVKELKGTNFVVFIDDFHYIAPQIQEQVATVIKQATREGLRFVLAAVPYHSEDVLLANADLRGRILALDFDYWGETELAKIAHKGFDALNALVHTDTINAFAREAAGSPQLMQSLCLNLCYETNIEARSDTPVLVDVSRPLFEKICHRTSQTNDYSFVIRAMKEGPKVRGTERNSYSLKDGNAADVYPIVVKAIAANPPQLNQSYATLLARIAALCAKDHPQGSSVTGACAHMASLANDASGATILEWDGRVDVLDIRDPYLLFALRWSETG